MFCIFCANSVFTEIEVEQLKLPGMLFTRFLRRTVWTVLRFSQNICWFWPVLRLKGRTKTYCYKKFYRTVARWCSVKKLLLEISRNSQENTCVRVSFLINFLEISKNTFFTEHLWTTTSEPCVYKTCLLNHLFEFAPKFPWPPFLIQIYLTFTEILPLPKKLKKLILNFITWITGAVAWGCSIYSRCPEKFLKLKRI